MKWFWNIGNLILLVVMLSPSSDPTLIPERYSSAYTLALLVSISVVVAVSFLTIPASGRNRARLAATRLDRLTVDFGGRFATLASGVTLIALTLLWSLPEQMAFVEALLLFNLVMTVAAASLESTAAGSARWIMPLLWALLALILVVSFFSAYRLPRQQVWDDEASFTNMAVMWQTTGQAYFRLGGYPPVPISPGLGWWIAPYGLWLQVFGVSLAAGRMFIWLVYVATVACIGWAGGRYYDRVTGLMAAVITAASPFMLYFRIIRPEIGLAVAGALLLIVYLASLKRPRWAFAAGWLAFLSMEIHAAGIALIFGIIAMFGWDALLRLRERKNPLERRQFALVSGLAVGALVYATLHILILPESSMFFHSMRSGRGFLNLSATPIAIGETLKQSAQISFAAFLLTILALAGFAKRTTSHDLMVLRFFLFTLIGYLFLVPEPLTPGRYLVMFVPFLTLGVAALLMFGFRAGQRTRPVLSIIALSALCASFLAASLPGVSRNPIPEAQPTELVTRIRELSTPEDVVVGDIHSYWGLLDYPRFYAINAEAEVMRGAQYESADELWALLAPDIVFNVFYPGFTTIPPALQRYMGEHQFEQVDSFDWEGYPVAIWRRPDSGK